MDATTTAVSPLPPLASSDEDLLNRLLDLHLCLAALARSTGRRLTALLQWRSQAHITAYINLFILCRGQADRYREDGQTAAALSTMTTIAQSAKDPVEQRRAATTILRATTAILRTTAAQLRTTAHRNQAPPMPQPPAHSIDAHSVPALNGNALNTNAHLLNPSLPAPAAMRGRHQRPTPSQLQSQALTQPQPLTALHSSAAAS